VSLIPPVVPSPSEVPPVQPRLPDFAVPGITVQLPFASVENTADVVYRAQTDLIIAQLTSGVASNVELVQLAERYYRDGTDYYSSVYGSLKQFEASKYAAELQLQAEILRLNTVPAGALQLQQAELANRVLIEGIRQSTTNAQTISASQIAQLESANRLAADKYAADQQLIAADNAAQGDVQGKVFTAQANKDASVYGSDKDLEGRKYAADQGLTGEQYGADKQFDGVVLSENAETARLTTKLAFAQTKFDQVYPFVHDSLVNTQNGVTTPGLLADPPFVSSRGVLTAAQIQAQINAAWAKNDSRTTALIAQTQKDLAGRGFSSNSPLLEAVAASYQGQNLRANLEAATSITIQAAQANADQVLKGQGLANDQYNQRQSVSLESERNQVTRQVGFVSALAQLAAGIT
jgi:hypothetical protein